MNASNPSVQILYILGHEHCGSTILEHHLSQHPGVFGAGEVSLLKRIMNNNCDPNLRRCSCGADPIVRCPVWHAVDQTCHNMGGSGLADIDPMSVNGDLFRKNNELLFSAIAQVTGTRLIIDSSKGIARLSRLIRETQFAVNVIHVTRPFAGYAYSHKKKYDVGLRNSLQIRRLLVVLEKDQGCALARLELGSFDLKTCWQNLRRSADLWSGRCPLTKRTR